MNPIAQVWWCECFDSFSSALSADPHGRRSVFCSCQRGESCYNITHRIHVWYICQHLGYIDGKCNHIYIAYMDPMGYGPVLIWDVGQRCSVGLHVKTILSTETGSWSLSHAGQALGSTVSHMESLLLFSYFPLKPLEAKDSLPVASCFSIVLAVVFACRFLTKIVSILWLLQVRPNAKWRMIIWACLGSQLKATGIPPIWTAGICM